jgi:probable metal-binding protein
MVLDRMETTATNEVHAHGVMEMMVRSGKRYSRASLVAAIHEEFGEGARFYACCAQGMTAEELIRFLDKKGKFSGRGDDFIFDPSQICSGH